MAAKTVVDATGNTYVVGSFTGTARFDALTLTSAGQGDVFLAKLDGAGNYLWAVGAGGPEDDEGTGLALDGQGRLYVTGSFKRTAAFGSTVLSSAGFRDVFVAQLGTSTGAWGWATGGGGPSDDAGKSIATDGTHVFLTGLLGDTPAAFGSTTLVNAANLPSALVAKLTSGGAWVWATSSSSPGAGQATAILATGIVADGSGGAYIVGEFSFVVDFGRIRLFATQPRGPGATTWATDLFVARLTPAGSWQWAIGAGGEVSETAADVVLGPGGAPIIVGHSNSASVTFGTVPMVIPAGGTFPAGGNFDVIAAQLTPAGAFSWATHTGGPGSETGEAAVVDAAGDVYIAGRFGPAPAQFGASRLASAGGHDAFVAKLSGAGAWQWGVSGGSPDNDAGATGVGVDGAGNVSAVGAFPFPGGQFPNTGVFGPHAVLGNMRYPTGFVARLGLALSVRISGDSLLCAGGQVNLLATPTAAALAYAWSTGATTPAITVNQAGTYSVVVSFAGGRTATASFTVRAVAPVVRILGDTVLCPGTPLRLTGDATPGGGTFRWSTGATGSTVDVSQPGVYSLTVQYGAGCAVTSQRTVTTPTVAISGSGPLCPGTSRGLTATASAPATFRWNTGAVGGTLTVSQAGTYTATATLATGCVLTQSAVVSAPVAAIRGDSVLCRGASVGLTAQEPVAATYRWSTGATAAGITVTQPGTYSVTVSYPGGCQSTASVQVRLAPALAPIWLGADTTACEGTSAVLRPVGAGSGLTYRWSTGATTSEIVVRQSGSYDLRLTTACETRTLSQRVEFRPCVTIPTIITPNGDLQNETFVIKGLAGNWSLQLYTRWGQRVYSTESYRNEWGVGAAPGAYYYLLRQNGNRVFYKGWLEVAP